jgi:AraC-like DNA-binding protein
MPAPLSELIQSVELDGTSYYRFEGAAPFAVRMPTALGRLCFHIVLEGTVVVDIDGAKAVEVQAGQVMLVSRSIPHTIMDRTGRAGPSKPALERPPGFSRGEPFRIGGPPFAAVMLCGEFRFDDHEHPVLSALPSLVHLQGPDAQIAATTATLVDLEAGRERVGREAIVQRLSEVLLIQVVRDWLSESYQTGLFDTHLDPMFGRIVAAIQAEPGAPWSVAGLAQAAGMSRSAFAKRFRDGIGLPPMEFVRRWRLRAAHMALRKSPLTLEEISEQAGYQSRAAFSKAFRREYGVSPGACRRGRPRSS